MLPEELGALAAHEVEKWWVDGVSRCRITVVKHWLRKAARQCVYCAVLRSHFWVGFMKEVS